MWRRLRTALGRVRRRALRLVNIEQHLLRRAQARSRPQRRGQLTSTSDVQTAQFGPLELEAYRLCIRGEQGLGLSVYVGPEEILRFDCLGATGHFHVNLQQSYWVASGAVERLSYGSAAIEAQVEESLHRLRDDLLALLRCNWRSAIRVVAVSSAELDAALEWSRVAFSRLSTSARAESPDSSRAG